MTMPRKLRGLSVTRFAVTGKMHSAQKNSLPLMIMFPWIFHLIHLQHLTLITKRQQKFLKDTGPIPLQSSLRLKLIPAHQKIRA